MPAESKFDTLGAWRPEGVRLDLFGGIDDHLRGIAILADAAAQRGLADREAVAVCLDPRASWSDRLVHFKAVIGTAPIAVQVRDPDALVERPSRRAVQPDDEDPEEAGELESRWMDHSMRGQRKEFLQVLLDTACGRQSGHWTLIRTSRQSSVTEALRERGVHTEPAIGAEEPDDVLVSLTELDPIVRAIARSLLADGVIGASELRRMVDGVPNPEEDVIEAAVDTLPRPARDAIRLLATNRAETTVNGTAGHFPWHEGEPAPFSVRKTDFELLSRRGLIVHRGKHWRVPRPVRAWVVPFARARDPDRMRKLHRWLAEETGTGTRATQAERHHHAVESEDLEFALSTVTAYAADLRALGYTISKRALGSRGPESRRLFGAAAAVYRALVEHFDDSDAYAWEYLGFNLERSGGDPLAVSRAYAKACDNDPLNPLYRGRQIGHRAAHGEDVVKQFGHWLAVYREAWGEPGIRWFADPVLRGFIRARNRTALATLRELYGHLLRESERLSRLLDEHG
jgi:hypothetical protein